MITEEPVAVEAAVRTFVLAVVALAAALAGWDSELRALIDAVVIAGSALAATWTRSRVTPVGGRWIRETVAEAYRRGMAR